MWVQGTYIIMGSRSPLEEAILGVVRRSGQLNSMGDSAAVYAAKGIIQFSMTTRHAMRPFVKVLKATCYPHMPIGKVWMYRLHVCFCVYVFVRLQISPPRIKLAASYFARRLTGFQCRE